MNDKRILFVTGIVLLFLMSVGFSYAYFSSSVSGNADAKDMVVEAGTLKLVYTDSPQIVGENIKPGWTVTKEVIVENTGTLNTEYNIIWQELTNEITKDEMVVSATCTRLNSSKVAEGTCENITEKAIGSNKIKTAVSIESGITHKYTFTFTFKEIDDNQNYNQGKKFNGMLGIEEYKKPNFSTDSWATIIANVKAGNGNEYTIGDTKEVDLGEYGTHTVRIANTSTPSECSTEGFSQTACGFVLEFAGVMSNHQMNPTNTNKGGWPASSMYQYLNTDLYNSLSDELKNMIIDTTVVSGHGSNDTDNFTSTDKFYLLSAKEIYEDFADKRDTSNDFTRQLDYYKQEGVTTSKYGKAAKEYGSTASWWWLRSASSTYNGTFNNVGTNGNWGSSNTAINSGGVSPAFRIG